MREKKPPAPDPWPAADVRDAAPPPAGGVEVAVAPGGSTEVADGATGPLDPGSPA